MNKKTMIAIVSLCSILLVAVVIACVVLLSNSGNDPSVDDGTKWGGLFSTEQLGKLPVISAEKREEEYKERPVVPDEIASQFDRVVSDRLSIGDFEYLDSYLYNIYEKYKDDGDENLYKLSSQYRSDLNAYNTMTEENGKTLFASFRRPETLASAFIYAPLSAKYDACVNQSSLVMPPPTDLNSVKLHEADMAEDELAEYLSSINEPRESKFAAISAFDMELYGLEFRLFIIQNEDGYYQPYRLTTVGGYDHLLPTASMAYVRDYRHTLPDAEALDHAIVYSKMDPAAFEQFIAEQRENPPQETNVPEGETKDIDEIDA